VCILSSYNRYTPRAPSSYPQNVFAFSGEAKSKKYAVEIVHECNEAWKKLVITGESPNKTDAYHLSMYVWCAAKCIIADLDSANSTVKNSKEYITSSDAAYASLPADSRKPPAPIDPSSEYTFVYLMAWANCRDVLAKGRCGAARLQCRRQIGNYPGRLMLHPADDHSFQELLHLFCLRLTAFGIVGVTK
jgi:hypothetical protein